MAHTYFAATVLHSSWFACGHVSLLAKHGGSNHRLSYTKWGRGAQDRSTVSDTVVVMDNGAYVVLCYRLPVIVADYAYRCSGPFHWFPLSRYLSRPLVRVRPRARIQLPTSTALIRSACPVANT